MTNFNGEVCICGCGQRADQLHHAIYVQHLRWPPRGSPVWEQDFKELRRDKRNLVPVALECHGAHHGRSKPLSLDVLPDSAFSFASEVLGAEAAYVYLSRRYSGSDVRLERLLEGIEA